MPKQSKKSQQEQQEQQQDQDLAIDNGFSSASSTSLSSNNTPATTAITAKKWDIIKTNNGKQRISQACDRCCIKKIKCDGKPGGCSNCNKIGFFCKTTDKMARSSFPKGYTKTLEKQVVELELANNKIKLQLEELQNANNAMMNSGNAGGVGDSNTNLLNFVNSFSDDDDFFNIQQLVQPRQSLKDDVLSFDQFKTNPLQRYLQLNYNLNLCEQDLNLYDENTVDFLDFNRLVAFYIRPLLHKDNSQNLKLLNVNKIDNLISKFFNHFNKLIPVLDFKNFYNQYLNFFNRFDIDDADMKLDYQFNEQDKLFIIKLLLIVKFNFNENSIFSTGRHDDYQMFQFTAFRQIITAVNFLSPTIDKFEIILLLLHYIYSFETTQFESATKAKFINEWCYELLSMGLHYLNTLGLNVNSNELVIVSDDDESLIQQKFIRLKLYWSFRILLRSIKIKFNYNYKNLKLIQETHKPDSLDSVSVLESDLNYTVEYLKMIKLVPINFTELSQLELDKIGDDLELWKLKFMNSDHYHLNPLLSQQLMSVFYHYKIQIDKSCVDDIVDNSYEILNTVMTYENKPKVARGRKKRNYNEMLALQQQKQELNINLISRLNSLSDFETLLCNDKLSCLDNNFQHLTLIACLSASDLAKVSTVYQVFSTGLSHKTVVQRGLLDKISMRANKPIDVTKELNDIHQSFIMPSESITSPSQLSLTSTSAGTELSFNMSRTSSISTTASANSIFMSRTPSLKQVDEDLSVVGDEIEVESLFGNYHHHHQQQHQHHHSHAHNQRNNSIGGARISKDLHSALNQLPSSSLTSSNNQLFKDDEDLMRLKATVISLTR